MPKKNELCPDCKSLVAASSAKPLQSSKDILVYLDHFRDKRQEYFVCLSLDSARRMIARRIVTIGLLDVSLAHPREVFAGPLTDRAASVIIAHNHPSGVVEPSKEDLRTTQQLVAAGLILGIPLQDHFIISKSHHFSFKQHSLI